MINTFVFTYKGKTEPIGKLTAWHCSRLKAAKYFAECKRLDLKDFLKIFDVIKF